MRLKDWGQISGAQLDGWHYLQCSFKKIPRIDKKCMVCQKTWVKESHNTYDEVAMQKTSMLVILTDNT